MKGASLPRGNESNLMRAGIFQCNFRSLSQRDYLQIVAAFIVTFYCNSLLCFRGAVISTFFTRWWGVAWVEWAASNKSASTRPVRWTRDPVRWTKHRSIAPRKQSSDVLNGCPRRATGWRPWKTWEWGWRRETVCLVRNVLEVNMELLSFRFWPFYKLVTN